MAKVQTMQKNMDLPKVGLRETIVRDFFKYKHLYLMVLPVLVFYIIFHYAPMYGAIIAFKNYQPNRGILGSPWVGFKYFESFFKSFYFWRVFRNTILINVYELIFAFPAPILFALLLNEVRSNLFKRTIQTITYLPHFISIVVICGMLTDFLTTDGVVNDFIALLGGQRSPLLQNPNLFRAIFVGSGIWQGVGWGSIIYLAALSGIDPCLYESAVIDGAGRLRQAWHITLPGILPTIIILLILRIGHMMDVGFEKIILLYNPTTYETADVISSFVYRRGLVEFNWSFSSAVGILNSVINLTLIVLANKISRKVNETSLW